MRYSSLLFLLFVVICLACTSAQINQAISDFGKSTGDNQPTSSEVAEGLKEALLKGVAVGADKLSQADGYFKNPEIKIPFPPDTKKVEDRLRQIGFSNEVDRFIATLNHGAEDAAKEAKPIFISAIQQMTIQDAWGILKGQQDIIRTILTLKQMHT